MSLRCRGGPGITAQSRAQGPRGEPRLLADRIICFSACSPLKPDPAISFTSSVILLCHCWDFQMACAPLIARSQPGGLLGWLGPELENGTRRGWDTGDSH